jgi:hypothetical protein
VAIYSLHIRSVGRSTHRAGTASAHVKYITRADAVSRIMGDHMPLDPRAARSWLDAQEQADRANARVVDKLMLALPRELTPDQRAQAVANYCRDLTGGRCAWLAAIHDRGEDAANPHAHIVLRDRDIETDQRVMRLSDNARDRTKAGLEPKAIEWVRERWEHHANGALERAGCDERIDRRSLDVQRIDREPQIHIGPGAKALEARGERPESKEQYKEIDAGRTRPERNAEVIDLAKEREQRQQAERAQQEEARKQADAERAAAAAEKAEREAKAAREVELYRQSLAKQAEREQQQLVERHAREREGLTRQQWSRTAVEQRQDARRDAENATLAASIERTRREQEGGGLVGWMMDKMNPARAAEREKEARERRERQEHEQRAEQERRQRERDERNRREQQELSRRHERERDGLQRHQAEREHARMAELREQQALRDLAREKARAGPSRAQARPDKSRERERERPGPDMDFDM